MAARARTARRVAPPLVAGGTLSKGQIETFWIKAGGAKSVAPVLAAIALAESGGNYAAINPEGPEHAEGLWQIKGQIVQGNPLNPEVSAQNAVAKYKSQGLGAWTTYTSGAYKKYLTPKQETMLHELTGLELPGELAVEKALDNAAGNPPTFGETAGTVESGTNAAKSALSGNWVSELLAGVGTKVVLPGILLLIGAVLVVYGIMVAVRPRDRALSIPIPAIA